MTNTQSGLSCSGRSSEEDGEVGSARAEVLQTVLTEGLSDASVKRSDEWQENRSIYDQWINFIQEIIFISSLLCEFE